MLFKKSRRAAQQLFCSTWSNQLLSRLPTPQVTARAEHLGSGLLHQGCQPNPNQFIGVFAQNRPEVILTLCLSLSIFTCRSVFLALSPRLCFSSLYHPVAQTCYIETVLQMVSFTQTTNVNTNACTLKSCTLFC